jgi:hypothetical protein
MLNGLGFNSDFYYRYNPDTHYFELYLNDIFDGTSIGSYNYNTGKMEFKNEIEGSFNSQLKTDGNYLFSNIIEFFNNYDENITFDKIQVYPINLNPLNVTSKTQTDFDTMFNQFVTVYIDQIIDKVN